MMEKRFGPLLLGEEDGRQPMKTIIIIIIKLDLSALSSTREKAERKKAKKSNFKKIFEKRNEKIDDANRERIEVTIRP